MLRQILMVAVVATVTMVGTADAGVRGGRFEGTLKFIQGGDPVSVAANFAPTGNMFLEETDFGIGDELFPGTFEEFDLLIFSFWSAKYNAAPEYEVSGFCLFGFISTYKSVTTTGDPQFDISGIVFKKGTAQFP